MENLNTLEVVSEQDKVYYAALLDGEGSIMLSNSHGGFPHLEVSIANNYFPVLLEAITKWGGTLQRSSGTCKTWRLYSEGALRFLKDVTPFLKIKKQEACWAIAYQEVKRTVGPRIKDEKYELLKLTLAEKVRQAFEQRKIVEAIPFSQVKEGEVNNA